MSDPETIIRGVVPQYCNNVEILTFCTREGEHMVLFRYYFHEPTRKRQEDGGPMVMNCGPVIIMPRVVAKGVLKKFLIFMAQQDEHGLKKPGGGGDDAKRL